MEQNSELCTVNKFYGNSTVQTNEIFFSRQEAIDFIEKERNKFFFNDSKLKQKQVQEILSAPHSTICTHDIFGYVQHSSGTDDYPFFHTEYEIVGNENREYTYNRISNDIIISDLEKCFEILSKKEIFEGKIINLNVS